MNDSRRTPSTTKAPTRTTTAAAASPTGSSFRSRMTTLSVVCWLLSSSPSTPATTTQRKPRVSPSTATAFLLSVPTGGYHRRHRSRQQQQQQQKIRFLLLEEEGIRYYGAVGTFDATGTSLRSSSAANGDENGAAAAEEAGPAVATEAPPPAAAEEGWKLPRAVSLYTDYAQRLWDETNLEARQKITDDKALRLVRQVRQMLAAEEEASEGGAGVPVPPMPERATVVQACDRFLAATEAAAAAVAASNATSSAAADAVKDLPATLVANDLEKTAAVVATSSAAAAPKKKKQRRSIWFGVVMGFAVACWVFSGNYMFTGLFTLMTILGQLEYYRMVINTGVYPARRLTVVGACSMYLTALFAPNLHQICLPIFGVWAMVWFLTMKRTVTTIPEIATTFTGMFYLGYVPSFWVRIRLINSGLEPTRLAPFTGPIRQSVRAFFSRWVPESVMKTVHLPITTGAIFIFWSWLCLAFSDVGAYFVGKNLGKTKLGAIAPAAGAASPNKTVEGVLGGCAASAGLAILGAWVQKWPYFVLTGAVHGIMLGLLGLVGDLTASMLKRDAGLKDFGDLLPGMCFNDVAMAKVGRSRADKLFLFSCSHPFRTRRNYGQSR